MERWQTRLLPLMVFILIGGALLFSVATLQQYARISTWMTTVSPLPDAGMWDDAKLQPASFADRMALAERRAEYALERDVIRRRYDQNNQAIATRLWARFMGFMTGMIMAIVGSAFVLGKLQDKGSELGGGHGASTISIKSASPGIVLAALGTVLIGLSLAIQVTVNVRDVPVYFGGSALPLLAAASGGAALEMLPDAGGDQPAVDSNAADAMIRSMPAG